MPNVTYSRITGLFSKHLQAFVVSIIAAIMLPLAPLLAELAVNGSIKPDSWTITAVTFSAAIGVTSRSQLVMILTFVASGSMAFLYGVELSAVNASAKASIAIAEAIKAAGGIPPTVPQAPPPGDMVVGAPHIIIMITAFVHMFERYGRHMVERRPFLEITA